MKTNKHSFHRIPIKVIGKNIPEGSSVLFDADQTVNIIPQLRNAVKITKCTKISSLHLVQGETSFMAVVNFKKREE